MTRVQGGQASDPPGDFSRTGRWPDWAASPLCRPGTSLCLCPQPGVLALDVPCPSGSPVLGAVLSAVRVLNLRAVTELPHLGNCFCHLVSRRLGSEDRECNCGSSRKAIRGRHRDTGTLPLPNTSLSLRGRFWSGLGSPLCYRQNSSFPLTNWAGKATQTRAL